MAPLAGPSVQARRCPACSKSDQLMPGYVGGGYFRPEGKLFGRMLEAVACVGCGHVTLWLPRK